MLSGKMLLVTAIWMAITIWGGFVLVARVYKHMATLRETEDKLYTDFQTVLEGRKELTLNRERAEYVFNNLYIPDAQEYRHHIIQEKQKQSRAVERNKADCLQIIEHINKSVIMLFIHTGSCALAHSVLKFSAHKRRYTLNCP